MNPHTGAVSKLAVATLDLINDNYRGADMKIIGESSFLSGLILACGLLIAGSAVAGGAGFEAGLSGAQEVPGVDTPGSGSIKARFDSGYTRVRVDLKVKNLRGEIVGAHFHCARPGGNGPVAFGLINPGPLSVDGDRIRGTLTGANFTGADCNGAAGRNVNNIAALAFAMRDGLIYLNLHTTAVGSGEIRGQLELAGDDD